MKNLHATGGSGQQKPTEAPQKAPNQTTKKKTK